MPKRVIRKTVGAVKWWWRLPRWVKLGKFLLILIGILSLPAMEIYQEWKLYHQVYDSYYEHFYASYAKSLSKKDARNWADYYADFYAKYYSSPEFHESIVNALPSATSENVSYPAQSVNAQLSINHHGLALLKEYEGLRLEPYYDVGGKLTIGYGHLIKPGEFYTRLTEAQAQALLLQDIKVAEAYIKRLVKKPLNYQQFSALASLVYNIGPGNFQRSTMLYALNNDRKREAAQEFLRWDKVGTRQVDGLSRRRKAEKALFES